MDDAKKKDKRFVSQLPSNDTKRYIRQLVMDDCTPANQQKLFDTRVLVVGAGGLGIPVCTYLVAAGIKNIGIMDGDRIELSNLHRQVLYGEADIGSSKVHVMKKRLLEMNSSLNVNVYNNFLIKENVRVVDGYDIVIDCSDNISTRYLLNDNTRDRIFVCASALRWNGEIYVFAKNEQCYRCLYPTPKNNPENCNSSGILGGICGTIGTLLSVEIIKIIFFGAKSKLIIYDGREGTLMNVTLRERQHDCLACNRKEILTNITLSYKQLVRVDDEHKITWDTYYKQPKKYDLIDIREKKMFDLAHVRGARNIPIDVFSPDELSSKKIPAILCARGVSAQAVAKALLDKGIDCRVIKDGLAGFKRDVDPDFPL